MRTIDKARPLTLGQFSFRTFLTLAGLKGAYLAAIALALLFWGDMDVARFSGVGRRWPREGVPVFARHFATWDAAHYLYLSEVGYGKHIPSCAFYPLWPLLVRWSSHLTGGSHVLAGMILANVCSLAGLVVFAKQVRDRWGWPAAKLSLLLLLVFPGALFFQFIYTEALFFLLAILLWVGLDRRRYGIVWISAFLLPLTRAVGLFCVFPIVWHLLSHTPPAWLVRSGDRWPWLRRLGRGQTSEVGGQRSEVRGQESGIMAPACSASGAGVSVPTLGPWWLLFAPLLGWGVYLMLMFYWTGNAFEGFSAQQNWGVHSVWNLVNVPKFVVGYFTPTQWHEFTGSLLDRCMFLPLLYCLPLLWRLDKSLFVWAVVLGVVPAMSGTFTSYTRFASCAFPMFIALALFLGKPDRRYLRWGTLLVFAMLHLVLLWRFVNFRWAG